MRSTTILTGFVAGELRPLTRHPQTPGDQHVRQPSTALAELAVADASLAEDDGLALGEGRGQRLVHLGEVEVHVALLP